MPLDDLPDTFLVFGEGSVLCVDLRLVRDLDFLWVVFKNFNVAVLELLLVNRDDGTNRVGDDDDHRVDVVAVKLDDQVGPYRAENLCLESKIHRLGLPRLDDT